MSDHNTENWVHFYQAAMLELKHALIAGRILDARAEIVKRIEKLRDIPGLHNEERRAIDDALRNLMVLEKEEAQDAEQEQRKVAEKALQELSKLHPVIEKLSNPDLE